RGRYLAGDRLAAGSVGLDGDQIAQVIGNIVKKQQVLSVLRDDDGIDRGRLREQVLAARFAPYRELRRRLIMLIPVQKDVVTLHGYAVEETDDLGNVVQVFQRIDQRVLPSRGDDPPVAGDAVETVLARAEPPLRRRGIGRRHVQVSAARLRR